MDKVRLTAQQANSLEYVVSRHAQQDILMTHGNNPKGWLDKASGLNDMSFNDLAKALIIGYEVELQPEDKLIEVYNKYLNDGLQQWHPIAQERHHLICQGINIAVDTLGLKIKGINT
ncbi:hypothetical protein A616_16650 [Brevibacillus brevis X23]|nr:hypothetical protein A616_16650 [Brevibacillus brevis X23]